MGYVGGQALIEGVMMKGDKYIARAVYSPSHNLIIDKKPFISFSDKYKFFKLPILRGFIALLEMMIIGMKSLLYSMNLSSVKEEQLSKKDMTSSLIISFLIAIGLFVVIPATAFSFLKNSGLVTSVLGLNLIEGLFRTSIFIVFLISTLFMDDMNRMYQYHGAEHKAVNAYEDNSELTIENVEKYSTIHLRCGTTFLMVVLIVSILVFSILGRPDLLNRIILKLLLFPLISGISYEIIRLAVRFKKIYFLLLWPGLLMQKITTKEPDKSQMFAAISALKEVI